MADLTAMLQAAAGQAGEATDPFFNQTTLLLHGDGTNGAQNNTFLDSSTNNFTITRNGNTTQGTFSPFSLPNGEFSNFFDGSGDYLSFANGAFNLGNNDFVIESFFYILNYGGFQTIAGGNTDLATNAGASWNITILNSTGTVDATVYIGSTVYQIYVSTAVPLNAWNHIAFVRTGGRISLYLNGTRTDTLNTLSTGSVNNGSTTYPPCIAANGTGNQLEGYLSNVRIIAGATASGIYDANNTTITVPTAPLSSVANDIVLTCQSNRFVDNSGSPKTITVNGNTSVQPFSPFLPSAAYSTSVNGGSGYFDGSGDTLDFPNNTDFAFGTGAFTIDFWIYAPLNNDKFILEGRNAIGIMHITTGGSSSTAGVLRYVGSSTIVSSNVITDNSWHHCAVVRDASDNITLYVDGVSVGTGTDTTNYTTTAGTFDGIGGRTGVGNYLTGYLSSFRIQKGVAINFASVGVPTAPSTSDANTSLLCNFTNAGIFDNTGKNNLETVGDAQIDTSVKKYGTGSIEFDGTGDWLIAPNNPNIQLGTGNFTIEFWVYLATGDTGSARGLVAKGGASTGWLVSLDSSQKVVFTFTTSTITSSGAITTNAWNHIAVVRSGTGSNQTKIYIAGTNDGTGTVSTDFNQTEVLYIGANRVAGDPMKGYIDDLRITKGVARYTAAFTPPTQAFPNL